VIGAVLCGSEILDAARSRGGRWCLLLLRGGGDDDGVKATEETDCRDGLRSPSEARWLNSWESALERFGSPAISLCYFQLDLLLLMQLLVSSQCHRKDLCLLFVRCVGMVVGRYTVIDLIPKWREG
jgi:hypothetical protein